MLKNNDKNRLKPSIGYLPKDSALTVKLPEKLRDLAGSVDLGPLHEFLSGPNPPSTVLVDMSITNWIDPLPLLALAALLRAGSDRRISVSLNLGAARRDREREQEHSVFLKFMASQGFAGLISQFATLHCEGRSYAPCEAEDLVKSLRNFSHPTNYIDADCIFAKLLNISEYHNDLSCAKLQNTVEDLVSEANNRSLDPSYGHNPLVRDRLLQKTRKILFELLSNVVDHAYVPLSVDQSAIGYCGVYARMRRGLPHTMAEADHWRNLLAQERKHCPSVNHFEPNPLASWIEIFVCDVGVGLLAHLNEWTAPYSIPEVSTILEKLKSGRKKDPLRTLAKILFTQPFSRLVRTEERTSVTGLLHIGLMLQQDSDFSRVYTAGEWVGNAHPWQGQQDDGFVRASGQYELFSEKCSPGTWFAISIQPTLPSIEYSSERWYRPDEQARNSLIDALVSSPLKDIPETVRFEDRRADPQCTLPPTWRIFDEFKKEAPFRKTPTIILRPPRALQKRQIAAWIERLTSVSVPVTSQYRSPCFVLADLSPFQAITYAELLLRHHLVGPCDLDIYLVTEDWTVCCLIYKSAVRPLVLSVDLGKARSFIRRAPEGSVSDFDPLSGAGLLRILRFADSRLFWSGSADADHKSIRPTQDAPVCLTELPPDMFLPASVRWSTSANPGEVGSSTILRGYLDLSRALVDNVRYQACCHALRRCMNLFPEFDAFPGDDLVRSVVYDADRSRRRSHSTPDAGIPNKRLVVGSIRVTSRTTERFLDRADFPEGSRCIHVLEHPDALRTDNTVFTVLDWLLKQEPLTSSEATPEFERIPETPYVGNGGEKAIVMPRFRRPTNATEKLMDSFYERTPQETYQDFDNLGALKFGHWVYGKSHDLLTVNLGRALELSRLDNGSLYQWLTGIISSLCVEEIQSSSSQSVTRSAVLVYPSHPVTDRIVGVIQERTIRGRSTHPDTFPRVRLIPLKFLSSSTVSPLLTSPLAQDILKKEITDLTRDGLPCRVVLLDDGTISGKVLRELEQLVRSMGMKDVHSVVILDRTGLPVHLDYMDDYVSAHHRYWRWDVPSLGTARGCPLCAALARADSMRESTTSKSMKRRLTQWLDVWQPVNVVHDWEIRGLQSFPFDSCKQENGHRFCIYPNAAGAAVHHITHRTSTGMTAAVIEITRSTTRRYYALQKARKLAKVYNASVGLEILCAQVLLFLDELNYWQRVDYFRAILELLWFSQDDSDITSLAALCVTLVDDEILADVWNWFKEKVLNRIEVPTIDASIAGYCLRCRYNALSPRQTDRIGDNPTDFERFNYLAMFPDGSFRQSIARLFEIIGESYQDHHSLGLTACIDELLDHIKRSDWEHTVRRVKEICRRLQDIEETLSTLDSRTLLDDEDRTICFQNDCERLRLLIDEVQHIERPSTSEAQKRALASFETWTRCVRENVCAHDVDARQEGREQISLARRCRTWFVRTLDKNQAMGSFLAKLIPQIDKKWQNVVETKLQRNKPVCSRWQTTATQQPSKPSIESGNKDSWPNRILIYFDKYINHCLFEILTNCVHAHEDIANPWNSSNTSQLKATMWWRVTGGDKYIDLEFVNACNATDIVLAPTPASAALEKVGGEILCAVLEYAETKPSWTKPKQAAQCCRPEEYSGVSPGTRLAVTTVRIPTMTTVKEYKG